MALSAHGTVLKFTPAGGAQVTVGRLTSIGEIAPDSEELDVTTLDAAGGYRAYIQGYKDAGTIAIEGFFDRGDAGQTALIGAYAAGKPGSAQILFPDGAGATFSAYVKGYSLGSAEVDGALGFAAQLRITGQVEYLTGTGG
jgi:predicted secreted protein